jgi:hypothetical protein
MNKKIILLVSLSFALLILVSACSGSNNINKNANSIGEENNQAADNIQNEVKSNVVEVVETEEESSPINLISYENDVLPILLNSCDQCHGTSNVKKGLSVITYDGLLAGSSNGAVITAGDAEASNLIDLVTTGAMPKSGANLTSEQIEVIAAWINQGALDN